jgi:hypothetical protein
MSSSPNKPSKEDLIRSLKNDMIAVERSVTMFHENKGSLAGMLRENLDFSPEAADQYVHIMLTLMTHWRANMDKVQERMEAMDESEMSAHMVFQRTEH